VSRLTVTSHKTGEGLRRLLYRRGVGPGFYLTRYPFLSGSPTSQYVDSCDWGRKRGEGTSKKRPLPAMKSVSPVKTAFEPSCSRK